MHRVKLGISLIFAALFSIALCLTGCSTPSPAGKASEGLVIIHTNDTHGYDQSTDESLGMAAVAQLKADYLASGYDVLLLDAGDALQGHILADDSRGEAITGFMNACRYDAAGLGNHEFDYGADILEERIESADFPVLCANIIVDATGETFTRPNEVFSFSDGTKVGIFGLDTPETKKGCAPKYTRGLTFLAGDALYACAQSQIDELRGRGCDIVVCLGHLGEEDTCTPNRAQDVIANTEGIDLFIDAHDHQVEDAMLKNKSGHDVPVVETGSKLENIGVAIYRDGKFTEELVSVGKYRGADGELAGAVDAKVSDIDARMSEKVGTAAFGLDGSRNPGVRVSETNLGDFIADAIRWEACQALGREPDAAIVTGGSIRASLDEGEVSLRNLHDAYPYSNQIYTIEATGAQILEALEAACQDLPDEMGSFPQVSGIKFTLDTTVEYAEGELYPDSTYHAPARPGSRVKIEEIGGGKFDPKKIYTVATTDFIATGGETYHVLAELSQSMQPTGYMVFQAMRYYLADECGGEVPEVYAEPQERIKIAIS